MSQSWIKLHTDLLYDPKILKLHPTARYAWIGLLLMARHGQPAGTWSASSAETIAEDLCEVLQIGNHPNGDEEVSQVRSGIDHLLASGCIRVTRCNAVVVTHWKKRQGDTRPSSDPSEVRARVRRHRERNAPVTRCNAVKRGVTPEEREERREKRREKRSPLPPKGGKRADLILADYLAFQAAYPHHRAEDTPTCRRTYRQSRKDASADTILTALERDKDSHDWRKEDGKYVPHPTKWLRRRRWNLPPTNQAPEKPCRCGQPAEPNYSDCLPCRMKSVDEALVRAREGTDV